MNYFTRPRYLALQEPGAEAMDAADAVWEEADAQYSSYLQTIRPALPEAVCQLVDGFYLHDARVLSMGRRSDTFAISLQLDVPPNELLTITYDLMGTPEIDQDLFPWAHAAATPAWLHDEVALVSQGGERYFTHCILFSNGWEARVPFRGVHLTTAFPTFPYPRPRPPVAPASTPRSA